jgi:membrane protein required for colicin V production
MLLYNPRGAKPEGALRVLMNGTDYFVILGILISAIVGLARGFLRESIALATWVLALFFAWHFADLLAPHLGGLLSSASVRPWAARAIIAIVVLLIGSAIGAILAHYVRLSIFSGIDRLLGFFFGVLRGLVLFGVFVILGQLLQLQGEHWWRRAMLIPYGETIANGLRAIVGESRVHPSADEHLRV